MSTRPSGTAAGLVLAAVVAASIVGTHEARADTERAAQSSAEVAYSGFRGPVGMAFAPDGSLLVANWSGGTVDRIAPDATRSVVTDELPSPSGLAIDKAGNIYVALFGANQVVRIDTTGRRSVFVSGLGTPVGMAFAGDNLVIANRGSGEIVSVAPDGSKRVLARGLPSPAGVAPAPDGSLYVANYGGGIARLAPDGKVTEITRDFANPAAGIVVNEAGRVFAVDSGSTVIREVLPEGRSVVVAEGIRSPVGLVLDRDGTLLVGAWGDGSVWRVKL